MKVRTILLFTILPFIIGFVMAYFQGKPTTHTTSFSSENILPTDTITLSNNGDIYSLNHHGVTQITHNQHLIEPVTVKTAFVAIEKKTNSSSLIIYDHSGNKAKTLFNGNSDNIDTMSWITDPSVNSDQTRIAYVSDKDRLQTNTPDNQLYIFNLADGTSTNIVKADPYSGGITHPIFNPVNGNIVLYDYYQYDPQTLMPYSTIEEYNKQAGLTTTLTFEDKNAYQESLSPDGKQILFLGRNIDSNTASLYLADFTDNGLTNIQILATGDFAYPVFSNTKNHIYYLSSDRNHGYNLLTATVQKNKLINSLPIVNGFQLQGTSSFSIIKNN